MPLRMSLGDLLSQMAGDVDVDFVAQLVVAQEEFFNKQYFELEESKQILVASYRSKSEDLDAQAALALRLKNLLVEIKHALEEGKTLTAEVVEAAISQAEDGYSQKQFFLETC